MYKNLSIVYDKLMDGDYTTYKNIISQELEGRENLLILDLGCGSGQMITTLSKYGKVFGVDVSEEMLAVASSKNSSANYLLLDLLDIEELNMKFDFVVSAFDVFNYLENFEQFSNGLRAVYNSMNAGAKFIFDVHTPEKIKYMLEEQPFAYEDDEVSYMWFTYTTEEELEVESELTFFIKQKNGLYKKIEEYQKQRTYEIETIIAECKKIGFDEVEYFCDFDKQNKDYDNSHRAIFVLTKK